jgi:hypothetical protein
VTPQFGRNFLGHARPKALLVDYQHPVGFSEQEAFDMMVNVKMLSFRIFFADVGSGSTGFVGLTRRRVGAETGGCADIVHTTMMNGALKVDWKDVLVDRSGRRGTPWYYPRVRALGVANNMSISFEPFAGVDGEVSTAVEWEGASRTENLVAFCDDVGTIWGTLIVQVKVKERYDTLEIKPGEGRPGDTIRITSVLGAGSTLQPVSFNFRDKYRVKAVRFGSLPARSFQVTGPEDNQVLEAVVPSSVEREPIIVETDGGDLYSARADFVAR